MSRFSGEAQIIIGISEMVFNKIPQVPQVFPRIQPYGEVAELIEQFEEGLDKSISDFQRIAKRLSKSDLIESVEITFNQINATIKSDLLNQIMKKREIPPERNKEIKKLLKDWIQEEFKKKDLKLTDEAKDAVLNMVISAMKKTDRILSKEHSG